ncbi:putative nucleotidyltransferase with HDIG domain [Pullulanibacillus pueri]|uniref:Cyclic-di-AMP phosphodiesterase PgpH n=1 Tax=Pullulanibacillus pueri TaxID=1437324 RepID=A0A8J3EMY3_9BACL|nr:HD family phosphohydrolase [Pullulanibacillus pueri]MBM7683042.1 putative nucleotidyltransferase with HDIG domain [Pullulanibacillus pueri]GGH84980.1 cyclic-di-AMP phosphodiesterase PgpH [Pullulanibacillus pueri]
MKFNEWSTYWHNLKKHSIFSWLVLIALGIVMFISMLKVAVPDKLDIKLHQIAKQDIQSPIEVVDRKATNDLRKQAVAEAPTSYVYNKDDALIQVEKANDLFNVLQEVRDDNNKSDEDKDDATSDSDKKKDSKLSLEDQIKLVHTKLNDATDNQLPDDTISKLLTFSEEDFSRTRDITSSTIYETMSNKIKWSDLKDTQEKAVDSIPTSVISQNIHDVLNDILVQYIVPNYVLDAKTTKRNKEDAENTIEPVVIRQGEVIVKKGDLITRDVIHKLEVVGLMDNHFNIFPFVGLTMLVLFLVAMIAAEFRVLSRKIPTAPNAYLSYLCIFVMTMLILYLGSWLQATPLDHLDLVIPIASGSLLITMLLNKRLSMISSIVFAICGGFIFDTAGLSSATFDYEMALYILFSCLAGVFLVRKDHARPKFLQIGCFISAINILSVLLLVFIKNGNLNFVNVGMEAGFALLSGFLSIILTIGLLPFFEATFRLLSPMKLIELSNPNHPLLRKILLEAPGTYHHSVMVANLAERACEVIGANGLLARVAAYYHDIGKTKRPRFFIENQFNGVNPHDRISPQLSRTVIIAHPYDGAKILREHKLPREIIDIAEQHHGTTLLKYFYYKAKEEMGDVILEEEFRYPGPKAQTKEAAVVELADSIEAAVRSMAKQTPEKIEKLVQNIFNDRLEDGQFDDCDITMKELHAVRTSIIETLNGIFHSRIEYPEEAKKEKDKKSV